MRSHPSGALLLTALLASLAGCRPPHDHASDLRAGTQILYEIDPGLQEADAMEVAETVKETVARRIDALGVKDFRVRLTGPDRLVVQLPCAASQPFLAHAREVIEPTGKLEFVLVAPRELQAAERVQQVEEDEARYQRDLKAWIARKREHDRQSGQELAVFPEPLPEPPPLVARPPVQGELGPDGSRQWKEVPNQWGNTRTVLHNEPDFRVSGPRLEAASAARDRSGRPSVAFSFDKWGGEDMAKLTGPNKGRWLAIVLDDRILVEAQIKDRLERRGELTGKFTRDQVVAMVAILRAGSLPAKLKVLSQSPLPEARPR